MGTFKTFDFIMSDDYVLTANSYWGLMNGDGKVAATCWMTNLKSINEEIVLTKGGYNPNNYPKFDMMQLILIK